MKNKFFLLLLFSLFFFPFNTFALSFVDCNNVEHQVQYQNYEDFRDWCYFNYYDDSKYSSLIVYHRKNDTVCLLPEHGTTIFYSYDNDTYLHASSPFKYKYLQVHNFDTLDIDGADGGVDNLPSPTMDFSSVIINKQDGSTYFSSNFTFNDIKTKYNCSSSVEPDPEEPEPDVSFPINKEEFYLLLVLLSLLIWLLYFKWCFPFTRGRDL